jgi:hypothetical protein
MDENRLPKILYITNWNGTEEQENSKQNGKMNSTEDGTSQRT